MSLSDCANVQMNIRVGIHMQIPIAVRTAHVNNVTAKQIWIVAVRNRAEQCALPLYRV